MRHTRVGKWTHIYVFILKKQSAEFSSFWFVVFPHCLVFDGYMRTAVYSNESRHAYTVNPGRGRDVPD